ETCLTELSKLHNEEVVTEHELRSEILRPYISEKTAPRLHIMTGSLSTEDNNFIRAVTSGRLPDETAKMPLSNIANTVAKLHGLGILMHDNAWHPQILWYLMRN
ncbi:hypothetical protein O5274_25860, partial [Escherichia coli]|nr:hypothetical protein [Escherichia coli]